MDDVDHDVHSALTQILDTLEGTERTISGDKTLEDETVRGVTSDDLAEIIQSSKDLNLDEDGTKEDIMGLDPSSPRESAKSDDEDGMPMIRMNSSIFEAQNDDDDDDEMDPDAIQSMMQVEMGEGESADLSYSKDDADESPDRRLRPRRHAAVVASNTIKQISSLEKGVDRGKKGDDDVEYLDSVTNSSRPTSGDRRSSSTLNVANTTVGNGDKHRCQQCKIYAPSAVVVRRYGTDIHLCSNSCFNTFRNPDPTFRPLPCAKCGMLSRDTETSKLYFWETMNFCSDLCVGNFQLQIGSVCSTCSKKTPWTCMGKYCVRFGSDIRQFCTAQCLESYKRNARVCFHCQLDIKKLGNVIIANVPFKNTPKEFCSQECVEQYRDLNNGVSPMMKPPILTMCHICKMFREVYKELVTSIMSYKVCSVTCWEKVKSQQSIKVATKCESCRKYINMDTISISPSHYVSSEKKAFGFCSPTCKNVFVLKTRQIRPCTTCQVKKYSYDLIQHPGGSTSQSFAVCSLNCLPRPSHHILNLKVILSDPSYVPPLVPMVTIVTTGTSTPSLATLSSSSSSVAEPYRFELRNGQLTSESGDLDVSVQEVQIDGISSLADGTFYVNGENTGQYEDNAVTQYYLSTGDGVTVNQGEQQLLQLSTEGMLQIGSLADAGAAVVAAFQDAGTAFETDQEEYDESAYAGSVEGEEVDLDDERWASCEEFVIIRHPEPPEQRNKGCQVKPFPNEVSTQTDSSELADMPRIEPKVKVLIVPVPILIPFPVYSSSQPVPVPYPVGIPVPIPIPVILDKDAVEPEVEEPNTAVLSPFQTEHEENDDKQEEYAAKTTEEETDSAEIPASDPTLPTDIDTDGTRLSPIPNETDEGERDDSNVIHDEDEDSSDVAAMLEAAMSPLTPPRQPETEEDQEKEANEPEIMFETGLSPFAPTDDTAPDIDAINPEFVPHFEAFPGFDADDVEMMDTSEPIDLLGQAQTTAAASNTAAASSTAEILDSETTDPLEADIFKTLCN